MLDKKGISWFLAITFGLTYFVEGALTLSGFRVDAVPALYGQLIIAMVMWVPALSTFITIKWITHEGFGITNFRLGKLKPYIITALLIPLAFLLIYAITWLTGIGEPDWQLSYIMSLGSAQGADMANFPSPPTFIILLFLASIIVSPFINSLFAFGEEFGWRGYLLPKLMPLGKIKAYSLLGFVWGIWHAPLILIGFNYPGYPLAGIVFMIGLTTALGIFINEFTLKNQSSILAGWIHGVFNSQGYGVWRVIFPEINPLWGGITGLIGIIVFLFLGFWQMRKGWTI